MVDSGDDRRPGCLFRNR